MSEIEETGVASSAHHRKFVADRIEQLLDESGSEALVVLTGTNVAYCTGYTSFFGMMVGGGFAIAVITPSSGDRPAVILAETEIPAAAEDESIELHTYPTFMYVEDPYGISAHPLSAEKPLEFAGIAMSAPTVARILRERGVTGRVAVEWDAIDSEGAAALGSALAEWGLTSADHLLTRAKAIKSPLEIGHLRLAAEITEDIFSRTVSAIHEGSTQREIARDWNAKAWAQPEASGVRLCVVTVGGNFSPSYLGAENPVKPGSLIKFDIGVTVGLHGADIARVVSFGKPSDDAQRRHDALQAGHAFLREAIAPGVPIADTFSAAMDIIRRSGLPDYTRGHLGHSVGIGPHTEESPILGLIPGEFEAGMVFSVETPYYGFGIGSMNIEDMIAVTAGGNTNFNQLPHELIQI